MPFPAVRSALLLLLLVPALLAEKPSAEAPRTSPSGYIEYWPGTLPIILSAPHGGSLKPKDLPDRGFGKVQRDGNTIELAMEIRTSLRQRFGQAPALIVCRLARVKCDCNREITEAAQGNAIAEAAWHEYHAFIDEAEKTLAAKHERGLYLDIHGHAHEKQRLELGYLMTKADTQLSDAELADPALAQRSSIRSLATTSHVSYAELLRGPSSLGGLFAAQGIPAVPSPNEVIAKADSYFSGGYDVATHGSRDGGKIDAVQVECPSSIRDTPAHRTAMAKAFSEIVSRYFSEHYQMKLP